MMVRLYLKENVMESEIKIKIKDFNSNEEKEFKLGSLNIVCGENNTGKSYLAYIVGHNAQKLNIRTFLIHNHYCDLLDDTPKNSFIVEKHPHILKKLEDIIRDRYLVNNNLNMSLYIKHIAKKGDLLIIEEPELGLHPKNQRLIARLLACLVNVGIKVWITTNSDYIVKEISTLIMLSNYEDEYLKKVAEKYGYNPKELLSVNKVKAYTTKMKEELVISQSNISNDKGIQC